MNTNFKTNKISLSIAIPTYEAGEHLIATLDSIYSQSAFNLVSEVILIIDGSKLSEKVLKSIKNSKLKIIYGLTRKGQSLRINDLFKISKSDLIVLTNDDILLAKNVVEILVKRYLKTRSDLISGFVKPLPANSLLEKTLEIGCNIKTNVSLSWNKGDNYLSCNGRLVSLSKRLYKKITIPESLWNNDAYLYISCKINHFKFTHEPKANAYYKSPNNISEHIKQSSKFKQSFYENSQYFKEDLNVFYNIPKSLTLKFLFQEFTKNPFLAFLYIFLSIITKLLEIELPKHKKGYWMSDKSTKNLKKAFI